jgi:hypothetical protein
MDFNNTSSSWLQPQQSTPSHHVVDAQSTHHEQSRSLSADDWSDRATLTGTTPNPLQQTASLDLSFTLGELSGELSIRFREDLLACSTVLLFEVRT